MEDTVSAASAIANILVRGKTIQELMSLQVTLQIICAVVNAEIAALRLNDSEEGRGCDRSPRKRG